MAIPFGCVPSPTSSHKEVTIFVFSEQQNWRCPQRSCLDKWQAGGRCAGDQTNQSYCMTEGLVKGELGRRQRQGSPAAS